MPSTHRLPVARLRAPSMQSSPILGTDLPSGAPVVAPVLLRWPDEAACAAMAGRLAARPELRDAILTLEGTLGAGKTSFARHLLRALGVTGRIKSPSYAVVEPHELPADAARGWAAASAWHFDFYRFDDPREWEDAGFRDLFAQPGLKLCEWPEKAGALLPPADLALAIAVEDDESRRVSLVAHGPRGEALLRAAGSKGSEASEGAA